MKINTRFLLIIFCLSLHVSLSAQFKYILLFSDKGAGIFSVDDEIHQPYLDSLLGYEAEILKKSKWLNGCVVDFPEELKGFQNKFYIDSVISLNYQKSGSSVSKWLEQSETSGLKDDVSYNLIHHGAEALNEDLKKGFGVKVAIFDGGFSGVPTQPWAAHLFDNQQIVYTQNVVNNSEDVYRYSSHGTSVLSIITGSPSIIEGSAPNAEFYLFVTEDVAKETPEEEFNWAIAAERAAELGVQVINSSLGYHNFDDFEHDYTHEVLDGKTALITKTAQILARKGILLVNSAGNERTSDWKKITPPADADSILAVAAIDTLNRVGSFSSAGNTADGRLKPDLAALGVHNGRFSNSPNISYGNGTSFAAPVITGLATRLFALFPNATAQEIRRALILASDKVNEPDSLYGNGVPHFGTAIDSLLSWGNKISKEKPRVAVDLSLLIAPNPSEKGVVIKWNTEGVVPNKISISKTDGKKIAEFEITVDVVSDNNSYDLSTYTTQLSAGLYYITVYRNGLDKEVLKFLKL